MLFLTFILGMNLVVSSVATAESIPQNDKTAKPENSTLVSTYQNSSNVESSLDTDSIDQITSVSQLSDVQPTDWAFQALRSLFERYGVIAGYPDGTFRGNQAMTRYEFAVALNTALNRVNQLIASGNSNIVTQEDLATLRKLQEDFAAELRTLGDRVNTLETRTQQLEANQFSTTTKLQTEAIFAISDVLGQQVENDNNTVFQQRVRLTFETSFTGKDRLKTRIEFGNFEQFDLPTNEGHLGFESNTDGRFEVGDLEYRFPLGKRVTIFVEGNDAGVHDFTDVINPFLESSNSGAISRFGRRNPIYRIPNTNAGLGARIKLTEALSFDFGYLAGEANQPNSGSGLFNGDYGAIGQLTVTGGDRFALGLTYIHSYSGAGEGLNTETGSTNARLNKVGTLEIERPVIGNSYGIEANYKISNNLAIGGWVGYTSARVTGLGDADIWNYALTLAFPNLGKEGNLGGIVVGMQPKLTGTSNGLRAIGQFKDPDTSLHLEGFYRYQLTDNIAITPGIIWLTAPNHDKNNDDIVIGTIRTTFNF